MNAPWYSPYIEPRRLLRTLTLPLFFAAVVVSLRVTWHFLGLPEGDALIAVVEQYFDTYGYLALFISAIIEGALVLGFYYPGAFIIFLSVIIAGTDVLQVGTVVGIVTAAFVIGLSIDYALGKYGWYRLLLKLGFSHELDKAENRLIKRGPMAIVLTYWDVNLASFTATAAGILRYPFPAFLLYSAVAIGLWNAFWATIIYFIGKEALEVASGNGSYALAVIGGWIIVLTIRHVVENVHRANDIAHPAPR